MGDNHYFLPGTIVEAYQLSADNMYQVEEWCGGTVKGIYLDPTERVIDLWVRGEEKRVTIGEWVVKHSYINDDGRTIYFFIVMDNELFLHMYHKCMPVTEYTV